MLCCPHGLSSRRAWRSPLIMLCVLAAMAGCGGHADGNGSPPPPSTLQAIVEGCDHISVNDNGKVIYVVLGRACAARAAPVQVKLGLGATPDAALANAAVASLKEGDEIAQLLIPGLGARRVGLFHAGSWRMLPNENSWSGRDGAGLLSFKGYLYLLGGWLYGPTTSEVWRTSDLVHWELVTVAPWPPRHGSGWLVHDGRMWVIGGDLLDDVWSSADGVQWVQERAQAPFGKRYTPNAASVGGYIVVYAGQYWGPVEWCYARPDCYAVGPRDVWRSRDGRQWELTTAEAPWGGRGLIHGSIVHNGEIFLVGGGLKVTPPNERYSQTLTEFSDIWSSGDGVHWTRRAERFAFVPRTHFSVLSTKAGCFVSDGSVGTQANVSNDLFFASDCINFQPVADTPPLQKRHASSLADLNGSLVILGGPSTDAPGTAIWQYFP